MSFFIGNSFCRLCQISEDALIRELKVSLDGLRKKGLIIDKFGVSARLPASRVIWFGDKYTSLENDESPLADHLSIYRVRHDVNAIFQAKSAYIYAATRDGLIDTIHAEATLVLGDVMIANDNIDRYAIGEPLRPIRVIIKSDEVYTLGACIHEARAFMEIMDEWARIKVIANLLGGARYVITLDRLRDLGARYSRAIKFGGRSAR